MGETRTRARGGKSAEPLTRQESKGGDEERRRQKERGEYERVEEGSHGCQLWIRTLASRAALNRATECRLGRGLMCLSLATRCKGGTKAAEGQAGN